MAGLWRRRLGRHANAISFWAVLAVVALALVFVTATFRRALPGASGSPRPPHGSAPR